MRYLLFLFFSLPFFTFSQNDLLSEIDIDSIPKTFTTAAFKGLKIVNFESTKLVSKDEFTFVVSHRFGSLENGIDTFFGLDEAVTRLNFIYGITEGFNVGISRSSFAKIYEGSIKYRIIRQKDNAFPVTIVGYHSALINTTLEKVDFPRLGFEERLAYTTQLLISRKVNTNLSLEFAPTFFHDNLVAINQQSNSQFALGFGGRYKLTKRWSINADYGLHLNRASNSIFRNPVSIGFDLETGGHVFQLHFTNAQAMNANTFLGQTTGNWTDGEIFFGFNLSRTF